MAFGYIIGSGGGASLEKAGDSTHPIYIDINGEAKQCDKIDLPVEGTIEKANQLNILDASGDNTFYLALVSGLGYQAVKRNQYLLYNPEFDTLTVSRIEGVADSAFNLILNEGVGDNTKPIYFSAEGIPVKCSDTLSNNISGNAATANKLNSNAGTVSYPVYFNNGVPVICDNTLANNISGNAATATTASACTGNAATATYATSAGSATTAGSCTGNAATATTADKVKAVLKISDDDTSIEYDGSSAKTYTVSTKKCYWNKRTGQTTFKVGGTTLDNSGKAEGYFSTGVSINTSDVLMGAAWNDYAEFRETDGNPGQVVCEDGSGKLIVSTKRLQKAANIISDTFGFTVGRNTEKDKPIAVAGRVLAFPDNSKFKVGDAVCSGKNGTVSKMNRLEIILFPDRIIGYVSEIPTCKVWGPSNINVNNRIWIKVR